MSRFRPLLVLSFLSVLDPSSALAITFNDGLIHLINAANSFPFESVIVDDGPGATPTTLQILAGGEVGTQTNPPLSVSVGGNSSAILDGGTVGGGFHAFGSAQNTIISGVVGITASATTNASLTISGGSMQNLVARDSSTIDVLGGTISSGAGTEGSSVMNVSGGSFGSLGTSLQNGDSNAIHLQGGTVGRAFGSSLGGLFITGGEITGSVESLRSGRRSPKGVLHSRKVGSRRASRARVSR